MKKLGTGAVKAAAICVIGLAVTLVSITATSEANAQTFVNGKPATAAEMHYLEARGFGAGIWRADGWGISAAHDDTMGIAGPASGCRYVLDVLLDCGDQGGKPVNVLQRLR